MQTLFSCIMYFLAFSPTKYARDVNLLKLSMLEDRVLNFDDFRMPTLIEKKNMISIEIPNTEKNGGEEDENTIASIIQNQSLSLPSLEQDISIFFSFSNAFIVSCIFFRFLQWRIKTLSS